MNATKSNNKGNISLNASKKNNITQ
jgi:hypothetical protein